jgi:hypothetical protein
MGLHNFPDLMSQKAIDREVRNRRIAALVGDFLGALSLFAMLALGLFAAAVFG